MRYYRNWIKKPRESKEKLFSTRTIESPDEKIRSDSKVGIRDLKDRRSPEWAYQAVRYLKMKWEDIDIEYERFWNMVQEIVANRSWEIIPTDKPYGSQDALFMAELGVSYKEACDRVRIAEEKANVDPRQSLTIDMANAFPVESGKALAKVRAENGKMGGRGNKRNHGKLLTMVSDGRVNRSTNDHLLRRLAGIDRDTGSQWIVRFKAGEFSSVRSAAIAAGIPIDHNVKLGNPLTVAQAIVRLMGKDYAMEIASRITEVTTSTEDTSQ